MELRGCSHLHFIQAIRAGSVEKILNVNSRGRPALSFKKLEDIYESEDDKIHDSLSTLKPEDSDADMVFDSDMVKTETKKGESNTEMSNCNADDDEEGTDGINSEKMTLKQLKEQCKTKKRKALRSLYLSPEQDYPDRHPEEDECDLEEPISSWKLKNPIGKKKRAKKRSSSPQTEISVKSDQISRAEDSMQYSPDLPVLTVKAEVPETEYTECRDTSCSSDDTSNFCAEQESCAVKPDLALGEKISLTEEEFQSCIVNELCFDHLEHIEPNYLLTPTGGETMDAENLRKTCQRSLVFPTPEDKEGHILLPLLEESSLETNFLVNDQGSDTSNHFQSNSSVHEISTQTNHACGVQLPDMAMDSNLCCLKPDSAGDPHNLEDDISENLPPNLEMDSLCSSFCNQSTSWNTHCSSPEIVLLLTDADLLATEKLPLISISGEAARDCLSPHERPVDFEIDSSAWEEKQPLRSAPDGSESNSSAPNLEMDFLSSSFCNHSTSWDTHYSSPEIVLLSMDDDLLASKKPPLLSVCGGVARDCLSPHKSPVDEVDSTAGEGKQCLRSSPDDSESNASEKDHCDGACKSPLPVIENNYPLEQCHPPERLLSTRKAISPTSQEKLRQAMEGVELDGQIDHHKCKDKLQFTKDTQDSPSPVGPDTLAEVDANPEGLGEVTRTSDAISPRQMTKKPRSERKGSPPRVFRRAPLLSRPLPHASTGAASIHSCSERAIAFSQRQMQDIESLATMLMEELKFMKDIVEEQVQSEAPPTTSLKYGVDEVKTAIKNATKAEEKTRKWLAMMTRDSNRFCKLMRLNEKKGEIAAGNAIHKDRKKITFADEAGGVLCHVKFIENSIDSPDSKN
ncbi:hypothetical protein Vadar_010848 [Vaccinium darrowii]|uniref:Uncharacterized protein n=1 Tax=Vaccinium darrowii TaxID=229202 RepID=A0ACB7Y661_9ERIC|nr:hypothetical protein Vadar_010848 [Vaccinium darrowii]